MGDKIKLIIFDFWGTIVENGVRPSPSKQVRYFLRVRAPFSEFVTTFESVFMTRKYDNLRQGFEEVTRAFNKRIPEFVYDKLVGMWNKFAILSKPFDDVIPTLEELKKDYKLVLLSNTDNFSLQQVMDKFDLAKYFDKIYLSCETGYLKHNPESFKMIFKDFNIKPEEALMVGDSPQSDLKSAEAAGVRAVLIDRKGWSKDKEGIQNKIHSLKDLRKFIESIDSNEEKV